MPGGGKPLKHQQENTTDYSGPEEKPKFQPPRHLRQCSQPHTSASKSYIPSSKLKHLHGPDRWHKCSQPVWDRGDWKDILKTLCRPCKTYLQAKCSPYMVQMHVDIVIYAQGCMCHILLNLVCVYIYTHVHIYTYILKFLALTSAYFKKLVCVIKQNAQSLCQKYLQLY